MGFTALINQNLSTRHSPRAVLYDGVLSLPLSQINERFTELDPNQSYYIHCKAGVRSLKALNFLRQQGFKYLKSFKGGITAWSEEIDSKVPRY